jgi:hypothetical protein
MRRHLALLALALAACTVDVEGAACSDDGHCPSGQRCGYDRTCSTAAAACAGPICAQAECNGQTLRACVPDAQGLCASLADSTCSPHQACHAGTVSCDCVPDGCTAGADSFCSATGELVACATEVATGCRYEASAVDCDAFRECQPRGVASASCDCQPSPTCTGAGSYCADGLHVVACALTNGCWHATPEAACAPGQACAGGFPGGACACPAAGPAVGEGCSTLGALSCSASDLLACATLVAGSPCNVWKQQERCASAGLVCDPAATACACPALAGPPFVRFADSTAPRRAGLATNGAEVPICRFTLLESALAASASGDTVKLTGSPTPIVFTEGALTIPADVAVAGDDLPLAPADRILEVQGPAAEGVRLEAGASLAGVTVRRGPGGPDLAVRVVGASPVGGASLQAVRVDAGGAAGAFAGGVLVEGAGVVVIEGVRVEGATGNGMEVARTDVEDGVTVTSSTFTGNAIGVRLAKGSLLLSASTVRESGVEGVKAVAAAAGETRVAIWDSFLVRNGAAGLWLEMNGSVDVQRTQICGNTGSDRTVSDETRKVGGIYAFNDGPTPVLPPLRPSLVFDGNLIHDNGGDQVLIGAGVNWDLGASSCGARNVVTSYRAGGGVGVRSIGAIVGARRWEWESGLSPPGTLDVLASQSGSVDSGNHCISQNPPVVPACPP